MENNTPKKKKIHIPQPGEQFGRLTVLYKCEEKYVAPSGSTANKYHVICSCDNHTEFDVLGTSLVTGNTRSCGCLSKESAKNILAEAGRPFRFKSKSKFITEDGHNKYDLSGQYGKGWTTNGDEFWFDLEDYEKIKEFLWKTKKNGKTKHVYVAAQDSRGQYVYLHRLVMGLGPWKEDKREVDHIFHNTLDNRKEKLRICEHFQNLIAQSTRSDNTSGRRGVRWRKERNKWTASITCNKKTYRLGCYDKFEEAVAAREKAEKELFGEFNFDDSTYDSTLESKQ